MKLPIILDEKGDLSVYDSLEKLLKYVEPIDVRNQEYIVYDSEGRFLQLGTATTRILFGLLEGPEVVTFETEEPTPAQASELRACISDFLTRVCVDKEWVARASLAELVKKALDCKTA
jgi:hypothetical protein